MSIHRVAGIVACAFAVLIAPPVAARVTRIVIDEVKPVPEAEAGGLASERIAVRAYGELDPTLPANALINDVLLARIFHPVARCSIFEHLGSPTISSRVHNGP